MPLSLGDLIQDRYMITDLLGQGGFGAVYRAWDRNLSQEVALKENTETTPEAVRQFEREALLLRNLQHPGLPRVTDYFTIPGQGQYLVMDLVKGEDLQQMLERRGGPLEEQDVLRWIGQVLDALAFIHAQDPPIIHRDIKPANIKITPKGQAVLVDFGIAKFYESNTDTTIGARAVTPGYSAQEQYGAGITDARSDLYSLGATMYTLLTGQEPVESVMRTLGTHLTRPRDVNSRLSPRVEAIILKAMQTQPKDRFRSADEMRGALLSPVPPITPLEPSPDPFPPLRSGEPRSSTPTDIPRRPPLQPAWQTTPRRREPARGGRIACLPFGCLFGLIVLYFAVCGPISQMLYGWNLFPYNLLQKPTATSRRVTPVVIPSYTPGAAFRSTPTSEPTRAPLVLEVDPAQNQVSDQDSMILIYIPEGAFLMGATETDHQAAGDEQPQRYVWLQAYLIDRTEVTNGMYLLCIQAGLCAAPENETYDDPSYSTYPVSDVKWIDAQIYCEWAGRRLPTEAEWEKAARGVDGRPYPWGPAQPDSSRLNFCDAQCAADGPTGDDGFPGSAPVGTYPQGASPYGLLDMAGNAAEWTADWYSPSTYLDPQVNNPTGPTEGEYRVVRGGSWNSPLVNVRATYRGDFQDPDSRIPWIGFRCAADLEPELGSP